MSTSKVKSKQKIECDVCGRELYDFMTDNISVWKKTGMCAVCTFGEADVIDA